MKRDELNHIICTQQDAWLRLGLSVLGNESDARDALQETLLRLWVVRERLETAADARALGTRIMKNECVNIHRRQRHVAPDAPPDVPTTDYGPHQRMVDAEQRRLLRWAIGNLSQQARYILQLHLYEDMSLDEITAATGKSKGAVKTMITRAKQQITSWLKTNT